MSSYAFKEIDELQSIHHGIVKLAGAELGVE
jgi:mannose-6-phosphate isomerase-like protein (cupin superfamily)